MISDRKTLLADITVLDDKIKNDKELDDVHFDGLTAKQLEILINRYQSWLAKHSDDSPKDFVEYAVKQVKRYSTSTFGRFLSADIINNIENGSSLTFKQMLNKTIIGLRDDILGSSRGVLTVNKCDKIKRKIESGKYNELEKDVAWTVLYANTFEHDKVVKQFVYKFLHNEADTISSEPFIFALSRYDGDDISLLNLSINRLDKAMGGFKLFNIHNVKLANEKQLRLGEAAKLRIKVPHKCYLMMPLANVIYGKATGETIKRLWGDNCGLPEV